MGSRKEEERNEKIIRGLMKLPPNRKCINCNSLGPQYVCTNFWTFICTTCSGIHREFTHRVKSVSMAKFTSQEVEALQKGGNQRAREIFLKDWDTQRMRLPDSSNVDRIRDFIKSVYVDKKYAGGKSSDKPPRDMQNQKNPEEDHRRASSYHSYSQSPPYEHQYEDRRYGKPVGMLTRKPGSDRGHYVSSFVCSPGRMREQMYEDRFANEGSAPRISDYSASSTGDTFRHDGLSPNFLKDTGYSSPPTHQLRDILVEDVRRQTPNAYLEANVKRDADGIPRTQRTASSGSIGSFDSNSVSLKSVNSGSLIDVLDSENFTVAPISETSTFSFSTQPSASMPAANQDLFGPPFIPPPATSSTPSSIDLFAETPHQPSSTTSSNQKPFLENEGWATFDLPQNAGPTSETKTAPLSVVSFKNEISKESFDAFASIDNTSQWSSVQSSTTAHEQVSLMAPQWDIASRGLTGVTAAIGPTGSMSWNAFDDSIGSFPQTSFGSLPLKNDSQVLAHEPCTTNDLYKDSGKDGFQNLSFEDKVIGRSIPLNGIVPGSSFSPSVHPVGGDNHDRKSTNPFDLPYDSDLEPSNAVMDMSSLQAALPNPQFPSPFLGGLAQPWFPQNPVAPYISSVPPGGLAFMPGQPPNSQLPNIPSQGPVAPLGGNPFA